MSWSYFPADLGTASTPEEKMNAVRLLVGDTNSKKQLLQNEEITFFVSQASGDTYLAASIAARTVSTKFIGFGKVDFDGVSTDKSKVYEYYNDLARRLEKQSSSLGDTGLGVPIVGRVSISDMNSVEDNPDRLGTAFKTGQFRNPPTLDNDDEWNWS